jgi:hypothetical protein
MKYIILPALFVLTAFAKDAYGCSIGVTYELFPNPDLVRISGVIIGYGNPRPVGLLVPAPNLRVRVQEVVSGTIRDDEVEVAFLDFGADCRSIPFEQQRLEEVFAVGTPVVVLGVGRVRDTGTPVVVVERSRTHFVVSIPKNVARTTYGDIDFQQWDGDGPFGNFEFHRVILALPETAAADRVSRLRNLAYYHWLRGVPSARGYYARLVSTSGVSEAEAQALREYFDTLPQNQEIR